MVSRILYIAEGRMGIQEARRALVTTDRSEHDVNVGDDDHRARQESDCDDLSVVGSGYDGLPGCPSCVRP